MKTSTFAKASILVVACTAVIHQGVAGTLTGYDATLPLDSVNAPLSLLGYMNYTVGENGTTTTITTGDPNAPMTRAADAVLNLGSFDIVISPGATLSGNAAALAAFNRAAAAWEARMADPITITITADLAGLGAGIIGSTSSVSLQAGYNTIRDQLVADSTLEGGDDAVVLFLPTAAQFSATIPAGSALTGSVSGTKASLKAAGFTGLDTTFGPSDASITFSTNFSFDFDRSNGIGAGQVDFETVAEHEIGHALGFVSDVDQLDGGSTSAQPTTLDLFRFRNLAAFKPTNFANFTTLPRNLQPNVDAVTSDATLIEARMSTGVALGDGRQASHWKADELTGTYLGIMDPTLANGVFELATENDFRAFDLIGYSVVANVPEPGSALLLVTGLMALGAWRKRS